MGSANGQVREPPSVHSRDEHRWRDFRDPEKPHRLGRFGIAADDLDQILQLGRSGMRNNDSPEERGEHMVHSARKGIKAKTAKVKRNCNNTVCEQSFAAWNAPNL